MDDGLSELLELGLDDCGVLSGLSGEFDVVLEFGLGSGSTEGGNAAVGEGEGDHLGARGNGEGGLVVGGGGVVAGTGEIADSADFKATTVLGVLAFVTDLSKDDGKLGGVIAEEVAVVGGVVAELALEALKFSIHRRSTGIQLSSHLGKDRSSTDSILVPAGITYHVSDGLFEGKERDATLFFGIAANVSKPLEASECLTELETLLLGQGTNHLGRDGRVHHEHLGAINVGMSLDIRIPRPRRKQHTQLVSGKDLPSSILELLGSGQAVGIRIIGDDYGRVFGIGGFESQFEGSLTLLGVGEGNGREVGIGINLKRHRDVGLEAEGLEGELHSLGSNSVHRRVRHVELAGAILALVEVPFADLREVGINDLFEGIRDQRGVDSVERLFGTNSLHSFLLLTENPRLEVLFDALLDSTVVGLDDLGSILPVDLVAIVVLGVVRGGDHDSYGGLLEQDSVRHVGGGHEIREQIHVEALMGEGGGSVGGKGARVVAAIITNNNTTLFSVGHSALSIDGESLRKANEERKERGAEVSKGEKSRGGGRRRESGGGRRVAPNQTKKNTNASTSLSTSYSALDQAHLSVKWW